MTGDELPRGRHYSLLVDQLTDERARKVSLDQRGISVISTSGTLVAITFGFITLGVRSPSVALPPAVAPFLVAALAGLVAASAAGLLINVPARVLVIDAADLERIVARDDWDVADPESSRAEYQIQVQLLIRLRSANRLRARVLLLALLLEVISLMVMAVSAGCALWPLL